MRIVAVAQQWVSRMLSNALNLVKHLVIAQSRREAWNFLGRGRFNVEKLYDCKFSTLEIMHYLLSYCSSLSNNS